MNREAGFTLLETLIAAAIGVTMVWGLLVFANRLIAWGNAANQRVNAVANAGRLVERMSSEAASALAVYVPAGSNEVDFFAEDGAHRTYTWSYIFDAATSSVTSRGEVYTDIDSFSATPLTVGQLGTYDPLFATASATDVPFTFSAMPGAVGGNRLVAVQITASGVDRSVLLASADAPTAFTVVVTYTPSPAPVATPTPAPLSWY
jgi:Tfp pilus assembly protein PilV